MAKKKYKKPEVEPKPDLETEPEVKIPQDPVFVISKRRSVTTIQGQVKKTGDVVTPSDFGGGMDAINALMGKGALKRK